jgi:small subunit ribosomal protein S1
VEGLVHISEIDAEKRINHPQDVLKVGEVVKAQVLAVDMEKRQIKLSIKQLIPTHLDEFFTEHTTGETVSGRVIQQSGDHAVVELGEGILADCTISSKGETATSSAAAPALDLSALSSMLNARWKGDAKTSASQTQPFQVGQVRKFTIAAMDAATKKIALELVS